MIQRTCGSRYHSSVDMQLNAGMCVALECNLSNGLTGIDLVMTFLYSNACTFVSRHAR